MYAPAAGNFLKLIIKCSKKRSIIFDFNYTHTHTSTFDRLAKNYKQTTDNRNKSVCAKHRCEYLFCINAFKIALNSFTHTHTHTQVNNNYNIWKLLHDFYSQRLHLISKFNPFIDNNAMQFRS